MIDIAYAIHDHYGEYYEYLGVSLVSVMENTKEKLRFHILCDDTVTAPARDKLCKLCASYGQEILFYDMIRDERIPITALLRSGYNEGILYRLYLPEKLPDISKVIYLDADILAHGDIRGLWDVDITGYTAAGRWDPPLFGVRQPRAEKGRQNTSSRDSMDWNGYVNSGVLIMDLNRLREKHDLLKEAISFWDEGSCVYPDQDALNHILQGEICFIPYNYNVYNKDHPFVKEGIFYHYSYLWAESGKLDAIDRLYLSYWEKTPFFRKEYGNREKASFLYRLKSRMDVYERLLELHEADAEDAVYYGRSLYLNGEYEKAYEFLAGGVIDALPFSDSDALSKEERKKKKRSLEVFRVNYEALSLEKTGRIERAIDLLTTTIQQSDDDPYSDNNIRESALCRLLGEILLKVERPGEAAEAFRKCLYFGTPEKNACSVYALRRLTECMLKLGDIPNARKYYTMLRNIMPLGDQDKILGLKLELAEKRYAENRTGRDEGIYLTGVEIVLTKRCTLRCRDCANLIQYYDHPGREDHDTVITSIRRLLSAVDGIANFKLLGGEPLLEQELLADILDMPELKGGKVLSIRIISNGTVPVGERLLESMRRNPLVTVLFSNYPGFSSAEEENRKKLSSENIRCSEISQLDEWRDYGRPEKKVCTDEQADRFYEKCGSKDDCCTVLGGRLYHCPRAAHGDALGYYRTADDEYVSLISEDQNTEELREKLRIFISRKKAVEACRYCKALTGDLIERAVQKDNTG